MYNTIIEKTQQRSEKQMAEKKTKTERILEIYNKLLNGYPITKKNIIQEYGVHPRTAKRDIEEINLYVERQNNTIEYNRKKRSYCLEHNPNILTNSEILAICKILLDSRAFSKEQIEKILDYLVDCSFEEKELIQQLILNEKFHYIETYHEYEYIQKMWEIGKAIQKNKYIQIDYQKLKSNNEIVKRKLKPIAILFSEYYFYLLALIEDKELEQTISNFEELSPTIYRIDRIAQLTVLNENFHISYGTRESDARLNEGEFRKRVQFMRRGNLKKVTFVYKGKDIHGVLDRLPTAEIISEKNGKYTIKAEVFGDGINMWFNMHRHDVDVIKIT